MTRSLPDPALEMRHLRLVQAIVEHGTLTSAARMLGVSQPALSHQLRELELRLRLPLFERTTRRMVLTPAGEQLTGLARDVLPQVDAFARQVVAGEFSVTRGTVRVATECYTAYHWLPPVLRGFRDRWPQVELRVAPEHTAAPIAALREGTLDLALVYHRTADSRIRFEPLFDDEMVLVVAPGHRLAGKDHVSLQALEKEHLFAYTSTGHGSSVVRDILESADVEPMKTTRVQLTEAILELVAAGFGVALLAKWAIVPAVTSGAVQAVRLGKHGYNRTWYTAVRRGDVTPAYRSDLVELLRRHLAAGPPAKEGQRFRVS